MKSLGPAVFIDTIRKVSLFSSLLVSLAAPAYGGVIVNSPSNGSEVGTKFTLSAAATNCSSQHVAAMGYSFDSSGDTAVITGTAVETPLAIGPGTHTLHVKAWGDKGSSCVTDVVITVSVARGGANAPSDAVSVSSIQTLENWQGAHDDGGSGSSSGTMEVVNSPSESGSARKFETKFSDNGDERYSVIFGDDTTSTNFLYDGWVYFTSSSGSVGNLEMDINQVMPNGQTAIFGVQCAGYSGTWEYTKNAGTPDNPIVQWMQSKAKCNPRTWSIHTWHHVQISSSRDDSGNITYQSVWLDGAQQKINTTVPSAFALGWQPTLQTQFQVDGIGGSGKTAVYLDNLTVLRW